MMTEAQEHAAEIEGFMRECLHSVVKAGELPSQATEVVCVGGVGHYSFEMRIKIEPEKRLPELTPAEIERIRIEAEYRRDAREKAQDPCALIEAANRILRQNGRQEQAQIIADPPQVVTMAESGVWMPSEASQ